MTGEFSLKALRDDKGFELMTSQRHNFFETTAALPLILSHFDLALKKSKIVDQDALSMHSVSA